MPRISELGHVGVHVRDLEVERRFYEEILGLTVTDEDSDLGMIFMSSRPDYEHHEFLLCGGRTAPENSTWLQQVAFRCECLEDVVEYYRRLKEHQVPLDMVVSHGNAVGVYFYDPEGNRLEVYWPTGLSVHQPFLETVDLNMPVEEIWSEVESAVKQHNYQSFVSRTFLEGQDIKPVG